jgi:ribosomal protein S18 acetylase RimI-like enzyme
MSTDSQHSNQRIEIRLLTPDDVEAYWHLRLEMLVTEPEAFGSSPEAHRELSMEEVRTRISIVPENKFVAGAFSDGRLVGAVGFVRMSGLKERHKGRIWGVYLKPQLRHRGIGRAMIAKVLEHAAKINGLEQIQLQVATAQAAAIAMYHSVGFISFACERRALKVGDRYIDEDYMVLWLKQDSQP